MRHKLILLFFIAPLFSFCQKDTILSFDVKIKYDSISKQDLYYEKINKASAELFEDRNFKIIESKIIKDGELLKFVRQGKLIKIVEHKEFYSTKTTKLLDETGNVEYIIYCENHNLKKIEKYNKNRIVVICEYGLINNVEEFFYNGKGYILDQTSNGNKTRYSIVVDSDSGKIVSKTKIASNTKTSIDVNEEGYYVVPEDFSSTIYDELKVHCE